MRPPSTLLRICRAIVPVVAVAAAGGPAHGQSAQPFSVQASALATSIYFNGQSVSGAGVEAQLRKNKIALTSRGVFSAGVGAQYTSHHSAGDEIQLRGLFLEPRYVLVLSSDAWFPYVAARVAVLQQSSNFTTSSNGFAAGGGVGIVYVLSRVLNLDVGGAVIRQSFGDARYTRAGPNEGLPYRFTPFTGFALKAGLNLGFGERRRPNAAR